MRPDLARRPAEDRIGLLLALLSWIVPAAERQTWRREWQAELTYYARAQAAGRMRLGRWWLGRVSTV
jgi:hypothetical protein